MRDCGSASDRPGWAIEGEKESISRSLDLPAPEMLKLGARKLVVTPEQGPPFGVAEMSSVSCCVDDVGEHHRGQHPVGSRKDLPCCQKGSSVLVDILGGAGKGVRVEPSPKRGSAEDPGPVGYGQHITVGRVPVVKPSR